MNDLSFTTVHEPVKPLAKPDIEDKPERPARPLVIALLILLVTLPETGRYGRL
jgi:hypothetical protein